MIDGAPLKYSRLAHAVAELAETPRYTVQPHALAMPGLGMLVFWLPVVVEQMVESQVLHVARHLL